MGYVYEKMLKLEKTDSYVRMLLKNMKSNGCSEDEALRTIYNSEVVGDSAMEIAYEKIEL